jgi:hypothetical protein
MLSEIANVAKECLSYPHRVSVWVPELGRYVCPDSEEGHMVLAEARRSSGSPQQQAPDQPRIDPQFKLVFLTAAAGTLLFVVFCVALTWAGGSHMPGPLEKLVSGLFDLAKIGFGAVVGLLGGKALQVQGKSK